MVTTKLMAAEELLLLPDDGCHKYELVRGVLITMAPPGYGHGRRASRLSRYLGNFADHHGGGEVVVETGFVLQRGPDTVRGPDVAFVSTARLPAADQEAGYFEGAPDIAAEVVSPGDSATELQQKVREYLDAGSRLVWTLDSRSRTVRVHRPDGSVQVLHEADTLTAEDVLPGFAVPVRDLFS